MSFTNATNKSGSSFKATNVTGCIVISAHSYISQIASFSNNKILYSWKIQEIWHHYEIYQLILSDQFYLSLGLCL